MEYSKAIEILRRHNEWRRGAEIPMEEPQVIGDAIDTVVENGCKEQPEVDLEEESYMRGFAQGAKEERERILADIKEIHSKAASEFAVHLVCTDSEPDCTTAKCGIRYALDALFSWLKANGCDMSAYYPYK